MISKPTTYCTEGGIISEAIIQRGFGVRPASFYVSNNIIYQKNEYGQKSSRRVSMHESTKHFLDEKKTTVDTNAIEVSVPTTTLSPSSKRNYCDLRHLEKQATDICTTDLFLGDSIHNELPVRKQTKTEGSIQTRNNNIGTAIDVDHDNFDSTPENNQDTCTETTDPCNSSTKKPKRKVGFYVNDDGKVKCQDYFLSEKQEKMIDECNRKDLWWSKRDRLSTRYEASVMIPLIQKYFPAYQSATVQLISKFGGYDKNHIKQQKLPQFFSWYERATTIGFLCGYDYSTM
jgi:hypothetical protein